MRLGDLDVLKAQLNKLPMMSNWGEAFIPRLIDEQPTIDAVPVVRCRNCKNNRPELVNFESGWCETLRICVNPEDFCSMAMRKEADHEVSQS